MMHRNFGMKIVKKYLGDDIVKDYGPMLWSWFEEFYKKRMSLIKDWMKMKSWMMIPFQNL